MCECVCVAVFYIRSYIKLWRKRQKGAKRHRQQLRGRSFWILSRSQPEVRIWQTGTPPTHTHGISGSLYGGSAHAGDGNTLFLLSWGQGWGGEMRLIVLSTVLWGDGQLREAGGQTSHIPNNSCIANKEELPVCVCEGKMQIQSLLIMSRG